MTNLKNSIRSIPDFPKKGIIFRDITTLMQNPESFREANRLLFERYKNKQVDKIVGIDARGFVFGAVLADKLNVGFVPVRKKGKLPFDTITEKYELEYGSAEVELHTDAIKKGEHVIVIDDLIATGGTIAAAIKLIERLGGIVDECAFIVELPSLNGRKTIANYNVYSIMQFEGE